MMSDQQVVFGTSDVRTVMPLDVISKVSGKRRCYMHFF